MFPEKPDAFQSAEVCVCVNPERSLRVPSGAAEEREHGVSAVRHGPSGLRERPQLGLHGPAEHRA